MKFIFLIAFICAGCVGANKKPVEKNSNALGAQAPELAVSKEETATKKESSRYQIPMRREKCIANGSCDKL